MPRLASTFSRVVSSNESAYVFGTSGSVSLGLSSGTMRPPSVPCGRFFSS